MIIIFVKVYHLGALAKGYGCIHGYSFFIINNDIVVDRSLSAQNRTKRVVTGC